jgi:hypothetical protein
MLLTAGQIKNYAQRIAEPVPLRCGKPAARGLTYSPKRQEN